VSTNEVPPTHTSRAAGIALFCGLLALMVCWVPLVGVLAFPLGIAALVAGTLAIRRIQAYGNAGLGLAITGLVAGGIGLMVFTQVFLVFLRGHQGPAWQGDWNEIRELFRPVPR
jgi:tetrahydromethanopterin S-methyltransferase subunit C